MGCDVINIRRSHSHSVARTLSAVWFVHQLLCPKLFPANSRVKVVPAFREFTWIILLNGMLAAIASAYDEIRT